MQAALDGGFRFGDVDRAALLSCLSDASMEDILAMRKDDPWGVIERKLGLTAAVYEKAYLLHRAERLERFYGIAAKRALSFWKKATPTTGSAWRICWNSTPAGRRKTSSTAGRNRKNGNPGRKENST